jgi:hypothetical protein
MGIGGKVRLTGKKIKKIKKIKKMTKLAQGW